MNLQKRNTLRSGGLALLRAREKAVFSLVPAQEFLLEVAPGMHGLGFLPYPSMYYCLKPGSMTHLQELDLHPELGLDSEMSTRDIRVILLLPHLKDMGLDMEHRDRL